MASISLRGLGKRFGQVVAVEDLSLEIDDGEFIVLLGPSGCGKTTTMRMVAGLEEPTSGDILIGGKRVNDVPARDRGVAMVFQNYALYPHMTVGENIGYPLKVRGIGKEKRAEMVRDAAGKVGLGELVARRPAELSGGQRQRVALARAIVRTPSLFLMDEPLSNLDAKLRTVMRAQLKHLQGELRTTTIYVTHDQVEAMTLADRICILNSARIQQLGTPKEIYARPANSFVAGFIGSPPMNLVPVGKQDGMLAHSHGSLPCPDGAKDMERVVAGIRPEHLSVCAPESGDLRGEVYSSELLGDTLLLTVECGEDLLVLKVAPDGGRAVGENVGVSFERDRLHLFDPADGSSLHSGRHD